LTSRFWILGRDKKFKEPRAILGPLRPKCNWYWYYFTEAKMDDTWSWPLTSIS